MEGQSESPELQAVAAVALAFYDVVPAKYETHCVLVSSVAMRALRRLGVACELLPCQLWYAAPGKNHVVGFVGAVPRDEKWDGHVVCAGPDWFIDAATTHLRRDAGVNVTKLVASLRFAIPSQAIARHDIASDERIWWLRPPPGFDTTPPPPRGDIVAQLGDALYERVRAKLAPVAPVASCCTG